jgi:O-antigen ligase
MDDAQVSFPGWVPQWESPTSPLATSIVWGQGQVLPRHVRRSSILAALAFGAITAANMFAEFPVAVVSLLFLAGVVTWVVWFSAWRIERVGQLTILFLLINVIMGLASGGMRLSDLLSMQFWNNDGRLFVSYAPLVLLSVHRSGPRAASYALRVLIWAALPTVAQFTVYTVGFRHTGSFQGFFTHHTGAGEFYGLLAIMLLVAGAQLRSRKVTSIGGALLLPMLATGSRAALIAAACVLPFLVARYAKRRPTTLLVVPFLILVALALPFVASKATRRFEQLDANRLTESVAHGLGTIQWDDPSDKRAYGGPYWNAVWRVIFWRRAWDLFTASPFVGVGFGRYNDANTTLEGIPGFISLARGGTVESTALSAHNSILHFLAEVGVLGLCSWILIWRYVWRRCEGDPRDDPVVQALKRAMRYAIAYVMVASMLGHSFAAPSDMLILSALAGLLCVTVRSRQSSLAAAGSW